MWPCTDIENIGLLEPRDQEMRPFSDSVIDDTSESVEEDSTLAAVDGVE